MGLTPMMKQYLDIKEANKDALLLFRLGDFYELFFDDAVTASKELEITLTGRGAGEQGRAPMCGVPYHSAEQYIQRLIDRGYRVAICEQVEDPQTTKGLVRREVVRVITPGTTLRDDADRHRYLAALLKRQDEYGVCFVEVTTGEVWYGEDKSQNWLHEQLAGFMPDEIVVDEDANWSFNRLDREPVVTVRSNLKYKKNKSMRERVASQYGLSSLVPLDLEENSMAVDVIGFAFSYIADTQKLELSHFKYPTSLRIEESLKLDVTARRNLEVAESSRTRDRAGSLLDFLDHTKTSLGARTLRGYLERPLGNVTSITTRLDAVEEFTRDTLLRHELREHLRSIYDLDRLIGRVSFRTANARDLRALASSLLAAMELLPYTDHVRSSYLQDLLKGLPDVTRLGRKLLDLFVDEPPVSVREGGMIALGVDGALDEMRATNSNAKTWLADLERREREKTSIKNLKIGYNKVFGYYLEVSKSNLALVPDHYERRQTLTNAERFILPELKERESEILTAEERAIAREYELYQRALDDVIDCREEIQEVARIVGHIDALTSLAEIALLHGYVRPKVTEERIVRIVGGRHPVVEAALAGSFVPNDVDLVPDKHMVLLTGPNMGGKSTYMRQTALIVLMAHIGSFVPAEDAEIGLVDRIFTRIGASDDLASGQSTFMVEMTELAQILRQATNRSLVLLDEIGRGTATYDGLSIAEAVVEYLNEGPTQPFTLFATHYHELTSLSAEYPGLANYSVVVEEQDDEIVFLHTVVNRPADQSYGIQVAELAGLPKWITDRAKNLLVAREQAGTLVHAEGHENEQSTEAALHRANALRTRETAATLEHSLPLFNGPLEALVSELASLDVLRMTPIDAMTRLHELVTTAKGMSAWAKSE